MTSFGQLGLISDHHITFQKFMNGFIYHNGPTNMSELDKIIPSILHKSIAGRYRPVRVADGPITARYRFM